MTTAIFNVSIRSLTTFKLDSEKIEVDLDEDIQERAERMAAGYGAEVVGIYPESPTELLADTLRDCIGFVSAWAAHLSHSGKMEAFKTVLKAAERARKAYNLCERDIPLPTEDVTDSSKLVDSDVIENAPCIPRFTILSNGVNPHGYTTEATHIGETGLYDEVRVDVFNAENVCVSDIIIGISLEGEPRILLTTDGQGDDDFALQVFPLRAVTDAIEIL